MSFDLWIALVVFAFVSTATPGPNNLLLLTSGLRVGLFRSLPFIFGISVGFSALLVAVGYGLGQMFERFPTMQLALRTVGTAYFLWLAWGLVRADPAGSAKEERDLDFWTGVIFQTVNPKAWLMCITAIALFLPAAWSTGTLALLVVTFAVIGFPANMAWAGAGQLLRRLVSDVRRMRIFNAIMAALLVLSILLVWIPRQ